MVEMNAGKVPVNPFSCKSRTLRQQTNRKSTDFRNGLCNDFSGILEFCELRYVRWHCAAKLQTEHVQQAQVDQLGHVKRCCVRKQVVADVQAGQIREMLKDEGKGTVHTVGAEIQRAAQENRHVLKKGLPQTGAIHKAPLTSMKITATTMRALFQTMNCWRGRVSCKSHGTKPTRAGMTLKIHRMRCNSRDVGQVSYSLPKRSEQAVAAHVQGSARQPNTETN